VRIGPWIDPDSAEVEKQQPAQKSDRNHGERGGWGSRLSVLFRSRRHASAPPTAEDHPHRTAECPIDLALIERLDELIQRIYEQAVEQAWSLDWSSLASLRRAAADAQSAGRLWAALRKQGEIIVMLGEAARYLRRTAGSPPLVQ
jgi:protein phosphatase